MLVRTLPAIVAAIWISGLFVWMIMTGVNVTVNQKTKEPLSLTNVVANIDSDYNYVVVAKDLKGGRKYRININRIDIEPQGDGMVTVAILDNEAKKAVQRHLVFASKYKSTVDLTLPTDQMTYSLLLYAGRMGKTRGISACYHGVELICVK